MLRKITMAVVGLHLLLIGVLVFSPAKKIQQPAKHLVVHTKQPQAITTTVKQAPKKEGKTGKTTPPAQKPAQKKAPAPQTPKPAPLVQAPAPASPKQKGKPTVNDGEKKKKAKEKESEIPGGQMVKKTKPQLVVPTAPTLLQIEQPTSQRVDLGQADSYSDLLIEYLHTALHLPEYGEVKIQLTLLSDGRVVKLTVLNSESTKNKIYLEKNIPDLKFPRFEGLTFTKNEQTFILTFCNEI